MGKLNDFCVANHIAMTSSYDYLLDAEIYRFRYRVDNENRGFSICIPVAERRHVDGKEIDNLLFEKVKEFYGFTKSEGRGYSTSYVNIDETVSGR